VKSAGGGPAPKGDLCASGSRRGPGTLPGPRGFTGTPPRGVDVKPLYAGPPGSGIRGPGLLPRSPGRGRGPRTLSQAPGPPGTPGTGLPGSGIPRSRTPRGPERPPPPPGERLGGVVLHQPLAAGPRGPEPRLREVGGLYRSPSYRAWDIALWTGSTEFVKGLRAGLGKSRVKRIRRVVTLFIGLAMEL